MLVVLQTHCTEPENMILFVSLGTHLYPASLKQEFQIKYLFAYVNNACIL